LEQVINKNYFKNQTTTNFNAIKNKEITNIMLNKNGLYNNKNIIKLASLDILIKNLDTQALKKYLEDSHINTNIVSLGFFGNEPAYIIGAEPGDDKSPQLWVDKTHKFIVKEKTKNQEIIFDKWVGIKTPGGFFPRLITIKDGDTVTNYAISEKNS
jgi:hypothetical protein